MEAGRGHLSTYYTVLKKCLHLLCLRCLELFDNVNAARLSWLKAAYGNLVNTVDDALDI